jgi:hypothetical protein
MTTGSPLSCPRCEKVLEPISWYDAGSGQCKSCLTEFEFTGFPALTAGRTRVAAQAVQVAEESVCFFHPENRAETVCEDCGRLICTVCTIPFGGRRRCPLCVAAARRSDAGDVVRDRVLYDHLAFALALYPLLIFPVTFVTAPVALGFVIFGWKKPNSLVTGPHRLRLVSAAVLAVLEIIGWLLVLLFRLRRV